MNDFEYYRQLSFEELIIDPKFRRWVFSPTKERSMFWQGLMERYSETSDKIFEARSFLLATKFHFEVKRYSEKEVEANLIEVLGRRDRDHQTLLRSLYKKLKDWSVTGRWMIAACGLFVVIIGGWFILSNKSESKIYLTNYGQWEQLSLPDGSEVHLNANSKLTLGNDWSGGSIQKVWLEGEAFFDVRKKASTDSKFQVIVGELVIEVLGTQFNVQKRGEETEVFLKEGKIKLDMAGKLEYMEPGQFIKYSDEKRQVISRRTVPQESYTSWKEGTLTIDTSVEEFLEEIREIYGVEIDLIDSTLLDEIRNFSVPMENLETLIPILSTSLGRQITQDGNKLLIR